MACELRAIRIYGRSAEEKALKIIFMDIDDVSNSDRLIASCTDFDDAISPPVRVPRRGDPVVIALFNRACEVTGAKVVVSSTWLEAVGWTYTHDWLVESGFDDRQFHDHSRVFLGPSGGKWEAIVDWLKQHPDVSAPEICIVDDDPNIFTRSHPLRTRQVVVDGPDGLLLRHFWAIVQKLGKAKKEELVTA